VDGTGDIACTSNGTLDSTIDIVRSRLKAALDGWRLYRIGADLQERVGQFINPELDIAIKRQVYEAMTCDGFLPKNVLQVETLAYDKKVHVMVFVNGTLAGQAEVNRGSRA